MKPATKMTKQDRADARETIAFLEHDLNIHVREFAMEGDCCFRIYFMEDDDFRDPESDKNRMGRRLAGEMSGYQVNYLSDDPTIRVCKK